MTDNACLAGTVHHVSFRVDDLDESMEFYCGLLGCMPLDRPELPIRGAWLMAGTTQVHLIEHAANDDLGYPPTVTNPLACHVAFHVESLDAAEEQLKALQIEVVRGTLVPQLVIRDPTGNVIELTEFS